MQLSQFCMDAYKTRPVKHTDVASTAIVLRLPKTYCAYVAFCQAGGEKRVLRIAAGSIDCVKIT
jgi:hypothetical protein